MRPFPRFSLLFAVVLIILAFTLTSYAQTASDAAVARSAVTSGQADFPAHPPIDVTSGFPGMLTIGASVVLDENGAVVSGPVGNAGLSGNAVPIGGGNDDHFAEPDRRPNHSNIDGLITLATFDGAFTAQAGPSAGRDFRFTMIGNNPRLGGTTVFPANISEVSLQLLNADGSVFTTVPFAPFEQVTLESPNFEPLDYRSGHNIEYGDAVHRAQFFNIMKNNWHTLLIPKVVNRVTITVPFTVNIQLANGTIVTARSYFTGTAADGSTFVLMLSPLFNFFFSNEVVNEINLGNFTTNGLNTTMFPNTFLFNLNANNPNAPGGCCVLGFHTFFRDGVFPQSRWVTQYASWISPGLFGAGFEDVTALSHETAEAIGDPFVNNPTPNWQFPGQPANSKACQANLEEGDPIEVLPNATAAIEVKERGFKFIYHPQNIPLLQWFEMGTTSSAIDGAFSFPDETVLPHSAIPCPQ
jgi:hypothetical protein